MLYRVRLALFAVTMFAVLFPTEALAWTQNRNPYTINGSGSIGCGGSEEYPCVEWRQDQQVLYWLGGDLANEEVNLQYYTAGAIDQNWDGVLLARQPDFIQTTDSSFARVHYRMRTMEGFIWGSTSATYDGQPFRRCTLSGCTGWRVHFSTATVYYNYGTFWNNQGLYRERASGQWDIDIRCVALHEHGHVEGLGHHTRTDAVMYGNCSESQHESLQSDDETGLRKIYEETL